MPDRITESEIAELEKLHAAGTTRDWPLSYVSGAIRHIVRNCDRDMFVPEDDLEAMEATGFYGWDKYNDAPGITAIHNAFPRLAAAAREGIKAGGGVRLIAEERGRQVSKEGWDEAHDDGHEDGQMARAAACYAMPTDDRMYLHGLPEMWPWDHEYWKPTPKNRIRELVKAGALIAAEIDRLTRIEALKEGT